MSNRIRPIQTSRAFLTKKMETVGDTLKKERLKLKKNLSSISLDTRIEVRKLKALEENNFSIFESPVSTKGFIKIYAEYLNLDSEKILAIYRRDFGEKVKIKEISSKKEDRNGVPWKLLYILLPLIFVLIILAYLYNQFSYFQNPPILEILEPENNITVEEDRIIIKGRTERDTIIEIENAKVPVDENAEFTTEFLLKPGDNVITVRATNSRNTSRESIEIIYVTYQPPEIEEIQEELIEEITLLLTIENSPTWIEIIVDDQMIVSQILPVGYSQEFPAKRNIGVTTGILQNTNVQINGDRRMLSQENFSIRCELLEGEINCN